MNLSQHIVQHLCLLVLTAIVWVPAHALSEPLQLNASNENCPKVNSITVELMEAIANFHRVSPRSKFEIVESTYVIKTPSYEYNEASKFSIEENKRFKSEQKALCEKHRQSRGQKHWKEAGNCYDMFYTGWRKGDVQFLVPSSPNQCEKGSTNPKCYNIRKTKEYGVCRVKFYTERGACISSGALFQDGEIYFVDPASIANFNFLQPCENS